MRLTRKQFFERIAGAGIAAAAGPAAVAGQRAGLRLGVALISFTGDYAPASVLESCVAAAAESGAEGIEIVGDKHIPGYPAPSERWIEQWRGWMARYKTAPSCYNCNAGPALWRDLDLATRLGFGVVRFDLSGAPIARWAELANRTAGAALRLGIRIALEPPSADRAAIDTCLEAVFRDRSGALGLVADRGNRDALVGRAGALAKVIHVRETVHSPHVFSREEQRWQLREDELKQDEALLRQLLAAGYSGFVSSVYEGPRGILPASGHLAIRHGELRNSLRWV